jgi:hypothetical protein
MLFGKLLLIVAQGWAMLLASKFKASFPQVSTAAAPGC